MNPSGDELQIEKGTRKTGRRKGLSWLRVGLGQFPKWKPFLKSESHIGLLALLGWEEKREGAVELVAMSVFVNRGRPEQSKRSVPQYTALLPTQAQVREQGIHTRLPLAYCLILPTFAETVSYLSAVLVVVVCFQLWWNPVSSLSWWMILCYKVWASGWICGIRLLCNSVPSEHIFWKCFSERARNICVVYCCLEQWSAKHGSRPAASVSPGNLSRFVISSSPQTHCIRNSGVRAQPCGSACSSDDSDAHSSWGPLPKSKGMEPAEDQVPALC